MSGLYMIAAGVLFVVIGMKLEKTTVDRFHLFWFGCILGMIFGIGYAALFGVGGE